MIMLKNITILLIITFYTVLKEVYTEEISKNENNNVSEFVQITRMKRQDEEDRWSWGYVDEADGPSAKLLSTDTLTSTTTTIEEPPEDPCAPYNPVLPDYRIPGRRISAVKCLEFIWQLNYRHQVYSRFLTCEYMRLAKLHPGYGFSVGGRNTLPGEFPHMAAIGWKATEGTWVFKCGSSLISPNFVLTAAHCTRAADRDTSIADPVPKIVRLGDKNIIDVKYRGYEPYDVKILRSIVHPLYNPPKKYYDIALMKLEESVNFTSLVQPACLWSKFDTSSLGIEATLTGWGVIETGSRTTSPELQAAVVDVIDLSTCDNLLKSACNRLWCGVQEHQLCAGKLAGGVDACQGDSGGPLQVKINITTYLEGQMHYVIGVTSFGIGCARENTPGIYTRVSSFIDWIEDIVWSNIT